MDLYEGTIVIRINGTQKPIDVQVHGRYSWTAKATIEAQYSGSFVNWWRGSNSITIQLSRQKLGEGPLSPQAV